MTKLKTVKDLQSNFAGSISTGELKEESIEWVKKRIKNCDYACRNNVFRCKEHKFWMKRLNITEEDLK